MSNTAVPGVSQDDYMCFVPVVNRFDLLDTAVASAAPYPIVLIDNSDGKMGNRYQGIPHVSVFTPPIPLTFAQTSNIEWRMAKAFNKKYYIHFHSDAEFPSERITNLLDLARASDAESRRWFIIATLHDILCAYNVAAMEDLGGYDAHMLHLYFCDNELWYRAKLAGYELIQGNSEGVVHGGGGSATINSDTAWSVYNGHTFDLYRQMYAQKWGGVPGSEIFTSPFNRPDAFPILKPLVP